MKNIELFDLKRCLETMTDYRSSKFNYFKSVTLKALETEAKHIDDATPDIIEIRKKYSEVFEKFAEKQNGQSIYYVKGIHPLLQIRLPKIVSGSEAAYIAAVDKLDVEHIEQLTAIKEFLQQENELNLRKINFKDLPTGSYTVYNNGVPTQVNNELTTEEIEILFPLIIETDQHV